MFTYLAVLLLAISLCSAVRNGEPSTSNNSPFGIFLALYPEDRCPGGSAYFGCGVTLVNGDAWGFPERRLVVTAAHCVGDLSDPTPRLVSFAAQPDLIQGGCPEVPRTTTGFGPGITGPVYTVQKGDIYVYREDGEASALGLGVYKYDYALMVLDSEATGITPATIAGPTQGHLRLSRVGTFGYGTEGWFTPESGARGGGKPVNVNGPRNRMYVEMKVNSIQNTNILTSMVYAQNDQSLCNADSGSTAIDVDTVEDTPLVYGVVSAGDMNCRSINTYTRIDTQQFFDWASTLVPNGAGNF